VGKGQPDAVDAADGAEIVDTMDSYEALDAGDGYEITDSADTPAILDAVDGPESCPPGYFYVTDHYIIEACVELPDGVTLPIDSSAEAEEVARAVREIEGPYGSNCDCAWSTVENHSEYWELISGDYVDSYYPECAFIIYKDTALTECIRYG